MPRHPIRKPNPSTVLEKMRNPSTTFTGKGFTVLADLTPFPRQTIAQPLQTVQIVVLSEEDDDLDRLLAGEDYTEMDHE